MLKLVVSLDEAYDEVTGKFVVTRSFVLELEHSLVSLSKWESFFCKPFLSTKDKTTEETQFYIRAMVLNADLPPEVFPNLKSAHIDAINNYINEKMTATWFSPQATRQNNAEVITAELIYHWMIELGVPFECQHWHLNKLFTLIRVRNEKTKPSKKMSKAEAMQRQRELNAQRRAQLGSRG